MARMERCKYEIRAKTRLKSWPS